MPNHRNVYISLATSMSKTGKFQLTPLVKQEKSNYIHKKYLGSGFLPYLNCKTHELRMRKLW